jgi:hypothetical protein
MTKHNFFSDIMNYNTGKKYNWLYLTAQNTIPTINWGTEYFISYIIALQSFSYFTA